MTTTTTLLPRFRGILSDHRFPVFATLIALVAFTARLAFVARGQGLHGMGTYDDGVYYAAAAAMAAGRLPYRDFLLLQPPMVEIVLLPFAAAARLVGDSDAFVAARVAFMAVGAVNTALVAVVLRRFGAGAVVVGATFYALFPPAIYSERSTLLEPIGTLGVLVALAVLGRREWSRPRIAGVVAGLALAMAVGAKLWYLVPAAIIVVAFLRRAAWTVIGAVAGALAILLPFFLAAPDAMWRQLVQDQLGRPDDGLTPLRLRLVSIFAAPELTLSGRFHWLTDVHVAGGILLGSLALTVVVLLRRGGRVFAVMLVVELVLLIQAPSYYAHYAALTAPTLALVLGVAVATIARLARDRAVRSALYTGVVVAQVAGVVLFLGTSDYGVQHGPRAPIAALTHAAAPITGCITADDPTVLALTGRLTPDLERGCPLWPDTTGYTYDRDRTVVDDLPVDRTVNARWQRDLLRYLTSGEATFTVRAATGLSAASEAVLDRGTVLYRHRGYELRTIAR